MNNNKATNINSSEETGKSQPSKVTKKSTKSRKSTKSDQSLKISVSNANNRAGTPTTPTTSHGGHIFDSGAGGGAETSYSSTSRSSLKSFPGFDPRSIKNIWEQHDQSDFELSPEVYARLAEDASYKLWEIINNIKIAARHSGGVVTVDLVNEVMKCADVPPALGAMDTDWDRIADYDGTFFFYSDKIIELRDEYQKEVTITMPIGSDYKCSFPVEDKNTELLQKYLPNLFHVCLFGDSDEADTAFNELAFSPIIGSCYRMLLSKIIQVLAFKQNDVYSGRCWRMLRACTVNSRIVRDVECRKEYFNLTEILICQLLATYESITVHSSGNSTDTNNQAEHQEQVIKMEIDDVKLEDENGLAQPSSDTFQATTNTQEEKVYKLQLDDDNGVEEEDEVKSIPEISNYFATPVDWLFVDDLCSTIGQLAALNGYFQGECRFHIIRRLERFFNGRVVHTEKEYKFISRAVRGLISLGEYAFREFLPFLYQLDADDIPEFLWNDFALAAIYLNGTDDIFLYEWMEYVCGSDKLQPFMVYYAHYHEQLLTMRYLNRKPTTFKINPVLGVRRLEWSLLAAAMCHGDDPNKALKPKPTISEVFPELVIPNLQLNRSGTIRFKFAGCRPVIIKPKTTQLPVKMSPSSVASNVSGLVQNDIYIARRRLFKPLTNERRIVPLSSFYFVRI